MVKVSEDGGGRQQGADKDAEEKTRWFLDNVLKHRKALVAYLRRLLDSEDDVQDVAQDVYLQMFRVKHPQDIEAPRAFLLRTAHNAVIQRFRRNSIVAMETVADFDALNVPNHAVDVVDQIDSKQRFAMLCEAVEQLPPVCRRIFIMRKVQGLSQREIAEALGISESTVEKHAVKGMRRCRDYLQQRGQWPEEANANSKGPKS